MGIKEYLLHSIGQLTAERPGRGKSFEQWRESLVKQGSAIERRAASAKNSAATQAALRHITGIERWSQSRLRVFLGAPYVRDEYDSYQPGAALDLSSQIAAFQETRAETIELVRQLQDADGQAGSQTGSQTDSQSDSQIVDSQADNQVEATVEHNDLGPLSARGWLAYLSSHASRESLRIR